MTRERERLKSQRVLQLTGGKETKEETGERKIEGKTLKSLLKTQTFSHQITRRFCTVFTLLLLLFTQVWLSASSCTQGLQASSR